MRDCAFVCFFGCCIWWGEGGYGGYVVEVKVGVSAGGSSLLQVRLVLLLCFLTGCGQAGTASSMQHIALFLLSWGTCKLSSIHLDSLCAFELMRQEEATSLGSDGNMASCLWVQFHVLGFRTWFTWFARGFRFDMFGACLFLGENSVGLAWALHLVDWVMALGQPDNLRKETRKMTATSNMMIIRASSDADSQ